MHRGTCMTHVPWCMSGSRTRGGGETFPTLSAHAHPQFYLSGKRPIVTKAIHTNCATASIALCGMWLGIHDSIFTWPSHTAVVFIYACLNLEWYSLHGALVSSKIFRFRDKNQSAINVKHRYISDSFVSLLRNINTDLTKPRNMTAMPTRPRDILLNLKRVNCIANYIDDV